jgi:hypothetical protein
VFCLCGAGSVCCVCVCACVRVCVLCPPLCEICVQGKAVCLLGQRIGVGGGGNTFPPTRTLVNYYCNRKLSSLGVTGAVFAVSNILWEIQAWIDNNISCGNFIFGS